mmetsp:Transcript_5764/g.13402  ORF Transcript_5764/g.13402 Transcript_5764/m.13402 type:complete len:122 (-) Transcript_5764:14-379(-)
MLKFTDTAHVCTLSSPQVISFVCTITLNGFVPPSHHTRAFVKPPTYFHPFQHLPVTFPTLAFSLLPCSILASYFSVPPDRFFLAYHQSLSHRILPVFRPTLPTACTLPCSRIIQSSYSSRT